MSEARAAQATARGDTLVLYTDGLIERRGEDIDIGLARLIDALARSGTLPVEELAHGLMAHMGASGGGQDDDNAGRRPSVRRFPLKPFPNQKVKLKRNSRLSRVA
ncbi:SpoIIE family protein phosphatase [Streptomyces massasporeus]|uniref:SpoIIE family protein phosphatase n=1 Tax=Streptomyces massasporeus TaxID=67324 RepID=UPI003724ACF3